MSVAFHSVMGGIAGAVIGAIGGVVQSTRGTGGRRRLSSTERAYAFEIFRSSIDYDAVQISRGSVFALAAATAIGNRVNLQAGHFVGDTLELSEAGWLVLIHELGHVWQFQNGGLRYIPSSLLAQIAGWIKTGSRASAYDWREANAQCRSWNDWNAEQQAECISDYNEALRRIERGAATVEDRRTVSVALPYIERVFAT